MINPMNYPLLVFLMSLVVLWTSGKIGSAFRKNYGEMNAEDRDDFGVVLGGTLTLLGLIIGFSFSMAINRYDQRKNLEEQEANAIGTEYVRADLLPPENAEKVRRLLQTYLKERELFYSTRDSEKLRQVDARTAELQGDLWNTVKGPAEASQTAVSALTLSGMNDVLNSQGYTQAAWWNRIPQAAWGLMVAIAICSNLMLGYYLCPDKRHWMRLMVMPLIVSISFLLISDIDSPRSGIIRVRPQNLESLSESLK
jgi:hypothetical protein